VNEQTAGTSQISNAAEGLKIQSDQTARAMAEQTKAMKIISDSSENILRQIKLITAANLEHSAGAAALRGGLVQLRGGGDAPAPEEGRPHARNGGTPAPAPKPPGARTGRGQRK